MICINCQKDISESVFTCDSGVAGRLDMGFECEDCEIVIWTHKVERSSDVWEVKEEE